MINTEIIGTIRLVTGINQGQVYHHPAAVLCHKFSVHDPFDAEEIQHLAVRDILTRAMLSHARIV